MITNCNITIVRYGDTPMIFTVNNVEWQESVDRVAESSGAKKTYNTAVFVYGKSDSGIRRGDYIIKGTPNIGSLTGKALLKALNDNNAQIVHMIEDNRNESIPFIELGCSL